MREISRRFERSAREAQLGLPGRTIIRVEHPAVTKDRLSAKRRKENGRCVGPYPSPVKFNFKQAAE